MPIRPQVSRGLMTCAVLLMAPQLAAASPRLGVLGMSWSAPASDEDTAAAREAYNEGEKAYRLGKFDEAAVAFERAYELSGLPDILYNIGLSNLRWYDVDPDAAHLRKAKVVFQNYVIEIQKNPDLGDLEEAEAVIAQIDEKLAQVESETQAPEPKPVEDAPAPVQEPDPGKKLRIGGGVAMGIGGALIVAGAVSGVVLGVKGQGFEDDLNKAYAHQNDLGCTASNQSQDCQDVQIQIDTYLDNGHRANALAVGLGLTFGGVGLIGVVTGAVLFVQGNKQSKAWQQHQVSLVPMIGGGHSGVVLSGRF